MGEGERHTFAAVRQCSGRHRAWIAQNEALVRIRTHLLNRSRGFTAVCSAARAVAQFGLVGEGVAGAGDPIREMIGCCVRKLERDPGEGCKPVKYETITGV